MLYLLSSEAFDSAVVQKADSAQRLGFESHLGVSEDEPARPVKQPSILVFDSLGGKEGPTGKERILNDLHCSRVHIQARLCQTLRDFLTAEWREKNGEKPPRVFTHSNMPGSAPKVTILWIDIWDDMVDKYSLALILSHSQAISVCLG